MPEKTAIERWAGLLKLWGDPPSTVEIRDDDGKNNRFAITAADVIRAAEAEYLLREAHEHISELRVAWERGVISEHDGKGGTRSNRNAGLEVRMRKHITEVSDA